MTKNDRIKQFLEIMREGMSMAEAESLLMFANRKGFFDAPASASHHANYSGGLFDHSFKVTQALVMLTKNNGLEWTRRKSPYIIGMFFSLIRLI